MQNFAVTTWGEETRWGGGSCSVWVTAPLPDGWLAGWPDSTACMPVKGQFQEITRHDVSPWVGRCEKWARKMRCAEFWGGCVWFGVREEDITTLAVSAIIAYCFLADHSVDTPISSCLSFRDSLQVHIISDKAPQAACPPYLVSHLTCPSSSRIV